MRITAFLVLLAISLPAFSQVSQEAFNQAVDYFNCRCVDLSLKSSNDFRNQCTCGDLPSFQKIEGAIPAGSKTVALSEEINKIKLKSYNDTLQVEEVAALLSSEIFSLALEYPEINSFAKKREKDTDFANLKKDLKEKIHQLIDRHDVLAQQKKNDAFIHDQSQKNQNLEARLSMVEREITKHKGKSVVSFGLDGTSIIFTFVTTSVLLFVFMRSRKEVPQAVKDHIQRQISKEQRGSYSSSVTYPSSREVSDLASDIKKLKTELSELQRKISSQTADHRLETAFNTPQHNPPVVHDNGIGDVLYLSTPNSDGSFNSSSATSIYREGASIYRFRKVSDNRAKFQIDERHSSIRMALQFPDRNIIPVCEPQNAFDVDARTIVTVPDGEGEVELLGDKWKLTRKARIRYER